MPIDELSSCVAHVKREFHRLGLHRPTSREASSTPRVKEEILMSSQKKNLKDNVQKRERNENRSSHRAKLVEYTRDEEGEKTEQPTNKQQQLQESWTNFCWPKNILRSPCWLPFCDSTNFHSQELESSFIQLLRVCGEFSLFHLRKSMQVSSYDLTVALVALSSFFTA